MLNQKINNVILSNDVWDVRHVLARYIKTNMTKVSRMTLTEIADECHVSKGMVSKFIKELGYRDYIQFKKDCNDYLRYCKDNIPKDARIFDNELNKALDSFIKIVNTNNNSMLPQSIDYFCEDVYSSKYLYVYGKDNREVLASRFQMMMDDMNSAEIMGFTVILVTDLIKERVIEDNSIFLSFSQAIENDIKNMFEECIHWNISDFFKQNTDLTTLYLFYWIESFSKQIYVYKL
ncbi:MAG: MurR/RpiR family transcriptional regulator [Beduini sp.]|uniref:MurR/RpiR family transcriptional regulator n=1 Tax=Beduini sp. TaxID=1922300 RepID=UPI0039906853